jgi:hypothetical protein
MHVIDVVLDSFSNLFRSHQYCLAEKLSSVVLFTAGLSLRVLPERLCLTGASRESVRIKPAVSGAMIKGCGEVYITCFKGQVAGGEILSEEGQIALYKISPSKTLRQ